MIDKVKKGSIVRIRPGQRFYRGRPASAIVQHKYGKGCVNTKTPLEGCTYWNVDGLEIKTSGGWLNAC